jgi:hypothetical protein
MFQNTCSFLPVKTANLNGRISLRLLHSKDCSERKTVDVKVPIGTHIAHAYLCIGLVFLLER